VPVLPGGWVDRQSLLRHGFVSGRHCLRSGFEWRFDFTGFENRLSGRRDTEAQQISILIGTAASAFLLGPILLSLNEAATVYVPIAEVAPGLNMPADLPLTGREGLTGPQAKDDHNLYHIWQKTDATGGPAGRYLVNDAREAVWLVDPGINGTHKIRPDKTEVHKFDAPKATLMSYIIKGMLDRKLPWGLIFFGVMSSMVLELCGVSSLAFAVGVYLPISSSAPIFIGGLIRWFVDRRQRAHLRHHQLSDEELAAESDKSPGVLLASGYIAGGAMAGIIIALMLTKFSNFDLVLTNWSEAHNPFFAGPAADALALIPFAALAAGLLWVARPMKQNPL